VEDLTIEKVPDTQPGVRIFKLSGPFILRTMFDFQTQVREGDAQTTIIDLSGVPYIDSAALGCLIGVHVSCQRTKRQYALAGATDRLLSLFKMCEVDNILVNYPTLEQAQRALIGSSTSA